MFENVPEWLERKVRALKNDPLELDRGSINFNAAGYTIGWYLGKNIRDTDNNSFFELPLSKSVLETDHPLWHAHVHRVLLIAETLFQMRNSQGFAEQLDRMRTRDLRSSFFEMMSAKQFLDNGFEVAARPETGRRGDDFDFVAIGHGQTINVEVTALTAPSFSEKTIANMLHGKRDQVPKTAPAVLFCILPSSWTATEGINFNEVLGRLSGQFLRGTKRWNVVVFWIEQLKAFPGGAASYFIRLPYLNLKKTYFSLELPFLFAGPHSADPNGLVAAIDAGKDLERFYATAYDAEFYRWIDTLVVDEK
jgi:hypothetical protein